MMKLLASSKSSFIQRTIGTILSTLVTDCNGLSLWPNLIKELLELNSLSAIERICEDAAFEFIEHPETFKILVESLFTRLQQGTAFKKTILNIISYLIPTQSPLLTENVSFLLENVLVPFDGDEDDGIKVITCRLLSTLLEFYWPLIRTEDLQGIFQFVLQLSLKSVDDDKDLLKECLEFWLFQVQSDYATDLLPSHLTRPLLAHLIPLLMHKCAYDDEEDEDELCMAMEDLSVPDEGEDLKPRHHRPKEDEAVGNEDEEESESGDDSIVTSIRKCSAACLDGLSLCIPAETFLDVFLPAFNNLVGSNDWKIREGALLALGAVAEGLLHQLSAHLDQIVTFLLANAHSHPHPLVRSMSLWTISRISPWLASSPCAAPVDECVRIVIESLGDANKRVQQSAATTICKFLESSEIVLSLNDRKSLISAIFLALKCYQKRSLLILYDLIRIFGASETTRADEQNLLLLDSEVFQYWRSIAVILVDRLGPESVADSSIFPIIEALMSLLLLDFKGNLLDPSKRDDMDFKALSLAAQNLTALKEAQADGFSASIVSEGLDDFLIAALDLLAAATESSKLTPNPQLQPLLLNILSAALLFKDSSNVRQSAFALIGDYALSSNPQILRDEQLVSSYFEAIQLNCLPSSLSSTCGKDEMMVVSMATATNAIWSLGEFSLRTEIPIPTGIINNLVSLLKERPSLEAGARIYFENAAVCIGRLLNNSTGVNIENSSNFLNRILNLLCTVESVEERETALAGYMRMIKANRLSSRDYQLIITKVNEMIDFTADVDARFSRNLVGFLHPEIPSDFYASLQTNLAHILHYK